MYYYNSPVGKMSIYQNSSGKYLLNICDIVYGHYVNAVAAADDVYMHVTGCYDWDSLDGSIEDVPTNIKEWDVC
ncbi:hypothetical protein [Lachnotalea glycerini]|uniref:Uncharacterized protein n=1 Tax=Lachnotalea glycerini TaxID=1763509 RepID=A0A371JC44_9FIRM|nr:hypothetical protein [Lachnotalea glycerini]RDY30321.1 hypothetical protein CG710_015420 [Lachnotalea glycerini]